MWKEELPNSCPPKKAIEQEIEVYRVLSTDTPTEDDFKNYCKLYPNNPRYREMCKAYSLSFYNSIENAMSALSRSSNLKGTHIAKYLIDTTHGVCEFKSTSGHYSVWLYDSWGFKDFNPIKIYPLNGN